jgi:glutamate N-acetyltransferase/amino-acid N-acetyltransferase
MSVTAPDGFVANGLACGIKAGGQPDLALVATDDGQAVDAAGVFTSNLATAAPVQVSRRHLRSTDGHARAVVLNSGNANAATGMQGLADALEMAGLAADYLPGPSSEAEVLVCSTGLIGTPLDMEPIRRHMPELVAGLSREGGKAAAVAIMTTDTRPKEVVVTADRFTVGGMAKGAAMLAPHLATMLAVITTDARVSGPILQTALQAAADGSFNALTVDGCTSTNDTVLVLASGRRGPVDDREFAAALTDACGQLAAQMADDAEGATKVATISVTGAASDGEAMAAARKVAQSSLVKCSLYGQDPYWGRVVSELGSAGVAFDPLSVSVAYGGVVVCREGVAVEHDRAEVARHLSKRHVTVAADLGLGEGRGVILTSDLTHAYIDENMGTS